MPAGSTGTMFRAQTARSVLAPDALVWYRIAIRRAHATRRVTIAARVGLVRESSVEGHLDPRESGCIMPRVTVTTETGNERGRSILLSECVGPVHMENEHSSLQFLERLAWAISDAEDAERRFELALIR